MPLLKSIAYILLLSSCISILHAQNPDQADDILKRLESHEANDSTKVILLNELAYEYYMTAPERSLQYAFQALRLAQDISYSKGQSQGLRQIGIVNWAQAKYSIALKNFMTALSIAEKTNDVQIVADLTGNIGLVYHGLGESKEALDHQLRSLTMQRALKNKTREAVALNNLGDVYLSNKDYGLAKQHYEEALQIRNETKNMNGVATNIRNIGNVLEEQGQFQNALDQYSKSLRISDSISEKRGMSQSRFSIGSVYFKLKRFDQAKKYVAESLIISTNAGFKAFVRDAYLLLSQIAEAQHDIPHSFTFFKQYSSYKDSVLNLQVASEIAAQRLAYEMEKTEAEIGSLKKDAALQQSRLSQKNTLLISGSLTVVLLTCLAIMLFKNYANQKLANQLLAVKNTEISQQHLEIATQNNELIALNEEIRAQQDDMMASRDALAEKNASIASLNQNLEKLVSERTTALQDQNTQLKEYAFINAHKLRAPLARIMGLVNLLSITSTSDEQNKMLMLLEDSTNELDQVTKDITQIVENGLNVFQDKSS